MVYTFNSWLKRDNWELRGSLNYTPRPFSNQPMMQKQRKTADCKRKLNVCWTMEYWKERKGEGPTMGWKDWFIWMQQSVGCCRDMVHRGDQQAAGWSKGEPAQSHWLTPREQDQSRVMKSHVKAEEILNPGRGQQGRNWQRRRETGWVNGVCMC